VEAVMNEASSLARKATAATGEVAEPMVVCGRRSLLQLELELESESESEKTAQQRFGALDVVLHRCACLLRIAR
jgi:hypothetical protein